MTDNEFTMFIMLGLISAYAVFLRFQVRALRRKIEGIAVASATPAIPKTVAPEDPQINELKKRVQVLERITTDGHSSLDREIESLRHA